MSQDPTATHQPILDFFMGEKFSQNRDAKNGPQEKPDVRTPFKIVDDWVRYKNLLSSSPERANFDILIANVGPVYKGLEESHRFESEFQIWVKSDIEEYEIENLKQKLVREWHRFTMFAHETNTGQLLHPHFVGKNTPGSEVEMQWTVRTKNNNLIENKDYPLDEKGYEKLENFRGANGEEKKKESTIDIDRSGHGTVEFDETNLKRIEKLIPKRSIIERTPGDNEAEQVREDLARCHRMQHEEVHNLLDSKLPEGVHLEWTTFLGVPFTVTYEHTDAADLSDEMDVVPDTYRGGEWIIGGSLTEDQCTDDHHFLIRKLARLTWLLYNGKYNRLAADSRQKYAEMLSATTFSHETKHILSALDSRWLVDPEKKNTVSSPDAPDEEEVQRITDEDLENLEEWKIAPIPRIFDSTGRMLRLWAQTSRPSDVFEGNTGEINNWDEFIEECWGLALSMFRSFAVSDLNLTNRDSLKKAQSRLEHVRNIPSPQLTRQFEKSLLPKPDLSGGKDSTTANWMHIVRFLVATFGNCLKHGFHDRSADIKVESGGQSMSIEIKNEIIPEGDKEYLMKDWIYNKLEEMQFSPLVSTKGVNIIKRHAEKVDAKVYFDKDTDKGIWKVKIEDISVEILT